MRSWSQPLKRLRKNSHRSLICVLKLGAIVGLISANADMTALVSSEIRLPTIGLASPVSSASVSKCLGRSWSEADSPPIFMAM